MDTFSHALWGRGLFGFRGHPWLALMWGAMPDLVSFGAIGARTVESQVHRELASGLSMPVGFKNGTNGQIEVAIDAIRSARHGHWFPSLTKEGTPAILQSTGNPEGYLILRGGSQTGPNYHPADIHDAAVALAARELTPSIIVDCSHGNSETRAHGHAAARAGRRFGHHAA